LSNKSIPDVDAQDQDNNMQSNGYTSLPDGSLEFLAAAPLARPSFANNSLNGGFKSKDACGQGKSTLREVRKKSANSSLSNDATDMESMSTPPLINQAAKPQQGRSESATKSTINPFHQVFGYNHRQGANPTPQHK
jgi:hypothetical protein